MADIRYLGTAGVVAQLDTVTVGGVIEAGDIFTLTVTGLDGTTHEVTISAADNTIAQTVADIVTAWNNSTNSLTTGITAADASPDVTLTSDVAGVAFSVAATTTEANGDPADAQTFVLVNTTSNAGPSDWSSADNWSGGAVPGGAGGQDVFVEDSLVDILYGLDQSGIGNALDSLNISASYRGKIGTDGATGVAADYLQIKATIVNIGAETGPGTQAGSTRIKLDLGATASTVNVYRTAASTDIGKTSLRLKAANAATIVNVFRGSVGLAIEAGETSTVGTVNISWIQNRSTDSDVFISDGVTLTTINKTAGTCQVRCAATTISNSSGTLETFGTGAVTTYNSLGGLSNLSSTGTIATLNADGGQATTSGSMAVTNMNADGGDINSNSSGQVENLTITGGTVDFTGSTAVRTVTTPKLDAPGTMKYDPAVLTLTNKIDSDDAVTLKAS